jgi:hypothetical protein
MTSLMQAKRELTFVKLAIHVLTLIEVQGKEFKIPLPLLLLQVFLKETPLYFRHWPKHLP